MKIKYNKRDGPASDAAHIAVYNMLSEIVFDGAGNKLSILRIVVTLSNLIGALVNGELITEAQLKHILYTKEIEFEE